MKKLLLFISCLLFTGLIYAQTAIPAFKSNAPAADNPFPSIKNYDLILACRSYDNVAHQLAFNVMVLKAGHWQKLSFKQQAETVPLSVTEPRLISSAATDTQCDSLYRKLIAAKLFVIEDDSKLPKCNETLDLVDGRKQLVTHAIEEGPEDRIWLITPSKIRYLYYYAPGYFATFCPTNKDRQDVVKIIGLFNKGW
ncbi:hypothetical protein [Mucilaginibacter sp. UR6-11]|uniref:hypothetical protein n=1 Tax=Mucilaginibacter sp. UR6-11 TaxID=1435644 RepID=UPI001E4D3F3D|nr:hypothetical protein [Mucilaginibacter sp. UR6-11]MCC8424816.1 hypothetical protein [Mucilaginibacter sp. UR6-11]